MSSIVACSKCSRPLEPHIFNLDHPVDCPSCGSAIRALVFPALFHRPQLSYAEGLAETEASCFYHAENRAAVPCDSCGRFICGICRVDISGQTVCPSCIDAGIRTRKLVRFETRRIMYDTIALTLATVPPLVVWPSILTAPAAIYISLRYWRTPSSLVRRTRIRFIVAIILAAAQVVLWATVGILLLARWRQS
jgi:hypothetical protein